MRTIDLAAAAVIVVSGCAPVGPPAPTDRPRLLALDARTTTLSLDFVLPMPGLLVVLVDGTRGLVRVTEPTPRATGRQQLVAWLEPAGATGVARLTHEGPEPAPRPRATIGVGGGGVRAEDVYLLLLPTGTTVRALDDALRSQPADVPVGERMQRIGTALRAISWGGGPIPG